MAEKKRKGTGQFMLQGQTAGQYGSDPAVQAKGKQAEPARNLKP